MLIYVDIRKDELAANHKTQNQRQLCTVCCIFATCYRETGCFEKASVLCDKALVIAEEAGDRQNLGGVMADTGSLYQKHGQYDKSIGLLEQASAFAIQVSDQEGQGSSCRNLAMRYQEMGQFEKANSLYEQSVVIFEVLGDFGNLMNSVMGLGECLVMLGNYEQAIKHHSQYWDLSQQHGHASDQARAALNMGVLWTQARASRVPRGSSCCPADAEAACRRSVHMRMNRAEWLTLSQLHWSVTKLLRTESPFGYTNLLN